MLIFNFCVWIKRIFIDVEVKNIKCLNKIFDEKYKVVNINFLLCLLMFCI